MDPVRMGRRAGWFWLAALAFAVVLGVACERRPLDETDRDAGGAGGSGGSAGDARGSGGAGGAAAAGGGHACAGGATGAGGRGGSPPMQCADGVDNDLDGKIDYEDPECTGGHDHDESTFALGILHEENACRTDCFFDGNVGMGDDGCVWDLKCDPLGTQPKCPYDAAYVAAHPNECSFSASQSARCVGGCVRLVPNGCDCFGCCAVPDLPTPIRLFTTCTAADFGDPQKCPPCTQVTQCLNPCERCEICIGKTTLPDDCATGDRCAPPYSCPSGAIACGAYGVPPSLCPADTTCVTGCCLPTYAVP